jgi:hypothetical protein
MSYILEDKDINSITSEHTRDMIKNGYDAVSACEAWDWLKNLNDYSFRGQDYREDSLMYKIAYKMEKLGYTGHSGFSMEFTFSALGFLAKNGKDRFIEKYANISIY